MHIQVETLLPDVMYDLLEGTLQFEAKFILRHVITERYISYPKFVRLLAGLELGYMEADNRPSEIASGTMSSDKTLGQKGILVGTHTCVCSIILWKYYTHSTLLVL